MIRLAHVLYAVALSAMLSGILACAACFLASLWSMTRPAVTTRSAVLMTLWGTAAILLASLSAALL